MTISLYPPFRHWGSEGAIWIISDTHFGDTELAEAFGHPSDEEIIKRINLCIGRNDTLIHLGDVGDPEMAKRLRGYKVLITGNHDKPAKYEGIFNEIYKGPIFVSERLLLSHERIDGLPFAFNIHGHDHYNADDDALHLNACLDVYGYEPLNLTKFIKAGGLSKAKGIHRCAMDALYPGKEGS